MMRPATRELLLLIARCPVVEHCLSDVGSEHPCAAVVRSQRGLHSGPHQSPAPWNGDLERAPLLFVGSNPSINPDELHPTADWPDDMIVDFFAQRFGGGQRDWTRDGLYVLQRDGSYSKGWQRYWAAVHVLARALYGLDADQPIQPGLDYATSAVVHCKSRDEIGVARARRTCAGHYLDFLFRASGAAVIVCLGSHAAKAVQAQYGVASAFGTVTEPVHIGQRERLFAFLPHPNARGPRSAATLGEANLERVRSRLMNRTSGAGSEAQDGQYDL